MTFTFNDRKATQAAAFLLKENGGEMDAYLFIKMLYLADRSAMGKWAEPITGDDGCSMKYGPVVSKIYSLTKGSSHAETWCQYISEKDPDTNFLKLEADPGDDELSPAELEILKDIWARFHKFTFAQMKRYSHSLPEYDESVIELNTSKPIAPADILRALKVSEARIQEAESENAEMRQLQSLFGAV